MTTRTCRRWQDGQTIRVAVLALYAACAGAYLLWRLSVLNPDAALFSALFYLAELFGACGVALSVFTFWQPRCRTPPRPTPGYGVDVLIPTYGEPLDVLRTTALAAVRMRYPHRTWLLDDGARPQVAALAAELGCRYLARAHNVHAKAGNLNHALTHATGDLVAVLDADHVPEPHFLESLVGYFDDPSIAYVQSPQDYHNVDCIQFRNDRRDRVLWHDQSLFYGIGQAGRDHWNATTFCGTCALVRRSALDEVGGFATETVTEDMHTAVRLQRRGWSSAYHPEPLAYGIGASNYVEYLQQRLRWAHGNVQVLREERVLRCTGLTPAQRACYLGLGLSYFEAWARVMFYVAPAVALLTGIAPIGATTHFFEFFVPYFLAGWLVIEEFGRGDARALANAQMAMSRFPVHLLATLALLGLRRRFRITSKRRSGAVPAWLVLPQMLLLLLNTTAVFAGIVAPPPELLSAFSGGTMAVLLSWAVTNAVVAALAVGQVVRDEMRADRGARHTVALPMRVGEPGGADRGGTLEWLSGTRLALRTAAAPRTGTLALELHLPDGPLPATLYRWRQRANGVIEGEVRFGDEHDRDRLMLCLHACGWHRRVHWYGEPRTLGERVRTWLLPPRGKTASDSARWTMASARAANDGAARWHLCLWCPRGAGVEIVTFDTVPPIGTLLEIACAGTSTVLRIEAVLDTAAVSPIPPERAPPGASVHAFAAGPAPGAST